jgi:FkbM family methyltransferase
MLSRILSFIRNRWHPLRKLRKLAAFRWFQNRFDLTLYRRVPGTGLRVAMKLLRDASWLAINLEPRVQAAFDLAVKETSPTVFWDVGANLGFYSWLTRQYLSVKQVVMFEPDPTNFKLITKTIRKNGVLNCRPMNLALSDAAGRALFLVDRASGATGSLRSVSNANNPLSLQYDYQMSETISSVTATVDSLISEGLPAPDLMKIDVEGAEHLVLAGAENCLSKRRPVLILETSNLEVLRQLDNKGYSIFRIDCGNWLCIAVESTAKLAPFKQAFGIDGVPGQKAQVDGVA